MAPKVREFREKLGLTQRDLAYLLGVTESALRRWENGASTPHPRHRRALSKKLGVPEKKLDLAPYREPQKPKSR